MKNLIILMTAVLLFLSLKISAQNPAIKVSKISDSGTPMLFLPHIGCSSDMWKEIAEHYKKTNSCYLIDFAGFDTMKKIEKPYTEKYVEAISNYIKNQREHHKKITFKDEYLKILSDLEIDFEEKYLFEF